MRESDITSLYESMQILTPAHEAMAGLSADSGNNLNREMKDYFGSLLCSALDAIGISPKAGLGSLHLYQPETATLTLAAQSGRIQYKRKAASHSVSNGQGIISWVARHRRALLIHDINNSLFRSIYVCLNDNIRSELAVPMLAGNDLLGVLNLECTEPRAFSAQNVKSVWHAASWAATAYRFYQQSIINREQKQFTERLLQLCGETTTNTNGVEASLNTLSTLARDCLRAAKCDIWQYNPALGKFNNAGASYPDFSTQIGPRKRGWTEFILRTGCPIWIKDIESESSYKILFGSGGTWTDDVPASALPDNLNQRVTDLKVRCELGVPITVADRCSGVAWLKYDNDVQPPTPDDMRLVNGLAGQTGLVMECLARREDMVSHDAVQRISEQLTKNLFSTGPIRLEGFPRIEGYLISRPHHSNVGGDFCTSVRIDEQIAGILFGDGENHGITGALNMLPLITTFKAFGKETRSTTHMMDKLMSISKTIGVRGTAVYAIFTLILDKLWLSVTSAGHPSLIIIRGNHPTFLPTDNGPADGPMLGVPELKEPLAAERTQLHEGDMLILFTDGICKSPNPFTQRLEIATAALEAGKRDPQMVAQAIFDRATGGNNNAFEDDATVLTMLIKK
jgi:GAF domain-containing protein